MMTFYTDGSCRPTNPGPGGYGVICLFQKDGNEEPKVIRCYREKFECTTNNRMELSAINFVMKHFGHNIFDEWGMIPIVYTDSNYCLQTYTNWMFNWARNNWTKSDKKIPENLDLIQEYYDLYQQGYRIDLRKVKGHSGNKWNELVDKLATGEITCAKVEELYG